MPVKKSQTTPAAASTSSPSSVQWEDAPTSLTRRSVFMLIYGNTGSGRTTFALSSPGPVALLHSSEKIDGVIQPFAKTKDIKIYNFAPKIDPSMSVVEIAREGRRAWGGLKSAWMDAYNWARTIIIDTETDAWELIRLAYFGDAKPAEGRMELNWGPVNGEWKSLIRTFKNQNTSNLIMISQTEDEYKKDGKGYGERTGRQIRKGQKSIPFMADVIVRTSCKVEDQTYRSIVEKPWWNGPLIGMELEDQASNFPTMMSLLSETNEEEWS